MPIFLFALPVLSMAGIFYFLVSKRSTPLIRRVAIIAFILVVLTILVCAVFILSQPVAVVNPHYAPNIDEPVARAVLPNIALIIGTLLVFLFFTVLIIIAARRERRGRINKQPL